MTELPAVTYSTWPISPRISPEFAQAWIDALAEMPGLHADQTADIPTKGGNSYSYSYADLQQVLAAARPILHQHDLAVHQAVKSTDLGPGVETIITYKTGEQMPVGDLVMPAGGGAQQVGSAITYARRYSLTAALGLAVADDDGAAATHPAADPNEGLLILPSGKGVDMPTSPEGWANVVKGQCLIWVLKGEELAGLDDAAQAEAMVLARDRYLEALEDIGAIEDAATGEPLPEISEAWGQEILGLLAAWWEQPR